MNRTRNTGLALCVLLGAVDVVGLVGLGMDGAPPPALLIGTSLLGLVTVVGAVLAWRGRRGGVTTVVVTRLLSLLSGIPVFFTDEAPDWAVPAVLAFSAVTVLGLALIWAGRPRRS